MGKNDKENLGEEILKNKEGGLEGIGNRHRKSIKENFDEKDKPINNSDKKIEESKSGRFQPAVDKLADYQQRIEYGLRVLRFNHWLNPINVREEDKKLYETYKLMIENLKQKKKEVIDGMLEEIKQDERYKNLSDEDIEHIRDHISAGSTRSGFYFNDESINKIINN